MAATNRLLALVERKYTLGGAFRDCHHPEMIIWQATQAPSRSMYLEGRGPSWIEDYVKVGKKLKECGCTELCMCCNTAHYAIDLLEKEIGLPFINLLNEVAKRAKELKCRRVGMMCTDGLRKEKIYDKYFSMIAPEVEVIYPSDEGQRLVTKGICNAKNINRFLDCANPEHPASSFTAVCHELVSMNVDCIIGGCTDISNVFFYDGGENIRYIDSLDVLADAIVSETKNIQK